MVFFLSSHSPLLASLPIGLSILMFSNNQLCYLFHRFFPVFILLLSAFTFIIFFWFCSSFSKFLRWELRLLRLFLFSNESIKCYKFPLSTALAAPPTNFDMFCIHFHQFNFFLLLYNLWHMDYLELHDLISTCLEILLLFLC